MKLKKLLGVIIACAVLLTTACGDTTTDNDTGNNSPSANGTNTANTDNFEKIKVIATTFPQYDWVREITAGFSDRFDLTLLIDNSIDMHNYQPSIRDIAQISTCDLFIYVGGHSDEWVEDVMKNETNPDMVMVSLMEIMEDGLVYNEFEIDHDHDDDDHDDDHDHDDDNDHDHDDDHDH